MHLAAVPTHCWWGFSSQHLFATNICIVDVCKSSFESTKCGNPVFQTHVITMADEASKNPSPPPASSGMGRGRPVSSAHDVQLQALLDRQDVLQAHLL